MSIATVVTMGYGSFGSVNFVPTIGYSIGVVVENSIFGESVEFAANRKRMSHANRARMHEADRRRMVADERIP